MSQSVTIEAEGGVGLPGELTDGYQGAGGDQGASRGARAGGTVIFAHGSGSSRHSPRNQAVARTLQEAGIGTLLFDLLTSDEEAADARTGELRFDVELLAARLRDAVDQLAGGGLTGSGDTRGRPIGLFGASTGAAGALLAADQRSDLVRAVVSRGGRPDLAGDRLPNVRAPTLLIVGGADPQVLDLNRGAQQRMDPETEVELQVVPGAGHLFEGQGELEQVARLAVTWFAERLVRTAR